MKTILITSQKGGSGKTTLARNLAVKASKDGERTILFDLDPQQSLREWWKVRESDAPAMLEETTTADQLEASLCALKGEFDLAIIDTPPAASNWLPKVVAQVDLAIVPVRPSPDDLRAVGATLATIEKAKAKFAFVLTQTPYAKITNEAARVIAQYGKLAPVNIAQRVIYAETGADGRGVTESHDQKATSEITELWNYVKAQL